MNLTKNFNLEEFRCKDGTIDHQNNLQILANQLQVLRDYIKVPIIINSSYRSPEYNAKIKGAENSYHVKGMAADIRTESHTPKELHAIILTLINEKKMGEGGLGLYASFVHYDFRGHSARWNG